MHAREEHTMPDNVDDLDAVRTLVATLEPFDASEQERIIRWTREKLGLSLTPGPVIGAVPAPSARSPASVAATPELPAVAPIAETSAMDIRTFVAEKAPATDVQFATVVAYYYRFEAPAAERKDSIGSADLQEACRQAGRARLTNPGQTLRNAKRDGLLDKAPGVGAYCINTVGENLVAMTLPQGTASPTMTHTGTKKKASKRKTKSKSKKKASGKKKSAST